MSLGVNVTMGAGFLTCPWAFTQSGIALGTIVMLVLSTAAIFCSLFVVESLARTEAVVRAEEFLLSVEEGPSSDLELRGSSFASLPIRPRKCHGKDTSCARGRSAQSNKNGAQLSIGLHRRTSSAAIINTTLSLTRQGSCCGEVGLER